MNKFGVVVSLLGDSKMKLHWRLFYIFLCDVQHIHMCMAVYIVYIYKIKIVFTMYILYIKGLLLQ